MRIPARPDRSSAFIWAGAACSCRCTLCPIDAGSAPPGIDTGALSLPGSGRLAVLVGGEPFVRRDLFQLLEAVRSNGRVPGLVTNARALVYEDARRRLREVGIGYLRAQLFGWQESHDAVTRTPGSFREAIDGLAAFVAENDGTAVDVALVLSPAVVDDLPAIVAQVAGQFPSPDVHIVLDGAGFGATDALRRAAQDLSGWNRDASRPLLVWEGVAQDVAPSPQHLSAPPLARRWIGTAAPPATCMGRPFSAARRHARPVANSFNYVRADRELPLVASTEECAGAGTDRDRQLWLAGKEAMALYATDTADFSPPEIARVKRTLGQLFFDTSPMATLDDFTGSLRRVVADPFCATCGRKEACGGRYRVAAGSPFRREEEWMSAQVAALRGRVLDVGCGEQLYRAALAPLVASGSVEYHGLDPDPGAIAALEKAIPGGRYHVGPIESFDAEPESFDHVLCLRSFDHLADPGDAFARMAMLLRPGGTLLVVECTPFALLREAQQVAWADRQPRAGHQHLRNWESGDVLPLARLHSLRVDHHRPVSLDTNNQWFLRLVREGDGDR